jgi:hypothetical protein
MRPEHFVFHRGKESCASTHNSRYICHDFILDPTMITPSSKTYTGSRIKSVHIPKILWQSGTGTRNRIHPADKICHVAGSQWVESTGGARRAGWG